METKINLLPLLILFAQRQNNIYIRFSEFCDFVRRYAQHKITEHPELLPFLTNPESAIESDLAKLQEQKIIIINSSVQKKRIIVIPYCIEKYTKLYYAIMNNPSTPFPLTESFPKLIPQEIIQRKNASTFLVELLEEKTTIQSESINGSTDNKFGYLYSLVLPHDTPEILLPSQISGAILFDIALAKIRQMLRKEESYTYFLKKLTVLNPSKDVSVKLFFNYFMQKPAESIKNIKSSGEAFYFCNQLCFCIRQDSENTKNIEQEDISIRQSVCIIEIAIAFFKNKSHEDSQRTTALRNLELALDATPYYFTIQTIENFTNPQGVPLLGQFTKEDLNQFLHTKTTSISDNNLPSLLTFKVTTGQRYYIYKSKVLPTVMRLCGEIKENLKNNLKKEWLVLYKNFHTVPEMSDQIAFEKYLTHNVQTLSPTLDGLLNSNFLSLVQYELENSTDSPKDKIKLFSNGKILPYSKIFMIDRSQLISDIKILLPFWYTTPIISWVARFILRPHKQNKMPILPNTKQNEPTKNFSKKTERQDFRHVASIAEKQVVPSNSTLEIELENFIQKWNRLLDNELRKNLIEDVNAFVRDCMRKNLRTSKPSNFTLHYIEDVADSLINLETLQNIKDKDPLKRYVVLYIIKFMKNS